MKEKLEMLQKIIFLLLMCETVTCFTVDCLGNQNVSVEIGVSGAVVNWTDPVVPDHVELITQTYQPGDFFLIGQTKVLYIFQDMNTFEVEFCSFQVIVEAVDNMPPTLRCSDTTESAPGGSGGVSVNFDEPTATDNSGNVSLLFNSASPGDFFPTGTTEVTYVYVDPSGNTGVCDFFVAVIEATLPPLVTLPLDCDGYAEGDSWEPQPCEFCSCVSGRKACASPFCAIPCENPMPGEGVCCPTCPDVTPTLPPLVTLTIDCDGHAEDDFWEPLPCESCLCVDGSKFCGGPYCYAPCANPIREEGACCPTCPDETQCKKVKKCRPRSFWNKDKCKCECHPAECLPGYKFNTKKCRCQCRKKKCPDGFVFDRKCCECKCRRNYVECEPGQYFSQVTCRCQTGNLD